MKKARAELITIEWNRNRQSIMRWHSQRRGVAFRVPVQKPVAVIDLRMTDHIDFDQPFETLEFKAFIATVGQEVRYECIACEGLVVYMRPLFEDEEVAA